MKTLQSKLSLRTFLVTLFLVSILVSGVTYVYASSATFTISSGNYPGAYTYTIYMSGSTYYAKTSYGSVPYSSANASFVLNSILNSVDGATILFQKATYYFNNPILVTVSGIHIILEQGTILYNNAPDYLFKIGKAASVVTDFRLEGGYIQGYSLTEKGFMLFYNTKGCYVTNTVLRYCGILNTWAVNMTGSWEIFFTNVQIYNVQNAFYLGGSAGYFEVTNCYANAWDYGNLGAPSNYVVKLDSGGFYAVQSQLEGGSGASTNGIYISGCISGARLIETTCESFTGYDINVTTLGLNNPSGIYAGYVNGSKINNPTLANKKMFSYDSFRFQNYGNDTISSSTSVTFDHNLWEAPTHVEVGWKDTGYGTWSWSATATQITITVSSSGSYDFSWSAYYEP